MNIIRDLVGKYVFNIDCRNILFCFIIDHWIDYIRSKTSSTMICLNFSKLKVFIINFLILDG